MSYPIRKATQGRPDDSVASAVPSRPIQNRFPPCGIRRPSPGGSFSMADYESMKAHWVKNHPTATPQQYQQAIMKIAKICGV